MIVAGQLKFDQNGRVLVVEAAPVSPPGSLTPVDKDGNACFENNLNPPFFNDEIGYGLDGRLCVQTSPPVRGRLEKGLRIEETAPIQSYWNGLPFTADGRLAVTKVGTPSQSSGFDTGFDTGYGS